MTTTRAWIALTLPLVACHALPEGSDAARHARFTDEYLASYYATHPIRSTGLGVHDHDAVMPEITPAGVRRRVEQLDEFSHRLADIDPAELSGHARLDHRILTHAIGAELFQHERVRTWARDPRLYNSLVARAVAGLAERQFAPLENRLRAMQSRLSGVPRFLAQARRNLEDVPALWVELAVRDAAGTVRFLEQDLGAMLVDQGLLDVEDELRRDWDSARSSASDAVRNYSAWLEQDLLPSADGDYRLGPELFAEKLRLEEFVTTDLDELWAMNERAILRYQDWVGRLAAEIDPAATPAAVMQTITADHPAPEDLVETARRMLVEARDFIVEREIVTLPSPGLPTVRPTPEYARMGFASMSTPGPFETVATEAYYNITNVDPEWSEEEQAQHLTYFNYPGLLGITVHEAMPGHFVQLLYEQRIPTDVRRVFTAGTLVEGWAHYTEQMMVDEGLGGGSPEIRLGQLRRALQRHARWYAGMALHVRGAGIEEVAARFAEIAYFAEFPALREVQRASFDPTYLYYALGRMQIFELREEYRRNVERDGRTFTLREFHDRFLTLGLPVPLAREVLIAE